MKRILGFVGILTAMLLGLAGIAHANQPGDFAGNVLHTDIRVYIDDIPIMGYNIDGSTYVVATQLNAYGFVVQWNEAARRVDISRGASTATPLYVQANHESVGMVAFPFYFTDIVTYVNGQRVSSFNVGGRTVVRITEVGTAAGVDVQWNDAARTVHVTTDPPL